MSLLNKYYKPWSFLWVLQRFIMVFKEGRLFKIQWKTLFYDFRLNKEINKKIILHPDQPLRSHETETPPDPDFNLKLGSYPLLTCENVADEELSVLNRYFDKIYVVNLEKRADRRIEIIQKLSRLKIRAEFFIAEDGYSEMNVKEYKAYLDIPIEDDKAHELEKKYKRKVIYSPGAWGTLKTYKNLFNDAIGKNYNRILCLQDDIIFLRTFRTDIDFICANIPDDWKLLYLGATQHAWNPGEDLIIPENNPLNSVRFSVYHPINTDGAFAVGIHHSVFPLLLDEIDKMNCSFDSGALRTAVKLNRDKSFVINPNLIIADVKDSDIRVSRSQPDFAKTAHWDMGNYDYPFK